VGGARANFGLTAERLHFLDGELQAELLDEQVVVVPAVLSMAAVTVSPGTTLIVGART